MMALRDGPSEVDSQPGPEVGEWPHGSDTLEEPILTPEDCDAALDEADTQRRIEARVRQRLFLSSPTSAPTSASTTMPTATRIGRFVVLEPIGRGGMGMVYAAYDEQLDRKVAVKVLLDDELPGEEDRLRFRREAQALARLSHPNVVTVHEVGESDGRFFLAMEYIRGQSLGAWLRTKPQWPEVLEVFVQAGRGLVAAHATGLVHRDLKPANIMRSDDGVVKVLDFGLARVADDSLDRYLESTHEMSATGSHSALSSSLTRTGAVVGTPVYMAPEQFEGETIDARSDQYSFCVALWEGLTGARPFEESGIDALLEAKLLGPPAWPSWAPSVPAVIVEALRRGLAVEPDDRWPSMEALLEGLRSRSRRRRSPWVLGLMGVAAVGLSGGATVLAWSADQAQPCSGARQQLAGVWDDERRAQVEAAILGVDQPYASDVWARTGRELDAYADAWVAMHTEACEATAVRAEQSARILDLRMHCLHRAAGALKATVDTLGDADVEVVIRAHDLVEDLRPLSRCADTEALDADVEPPLPHEAEAVGRARQHLARVVSETNAARYAIAQQALEATMDALEGVDYGPVRAEVLSEQGVLLMMRGEYQASEEVLSQALEHASRWGQREVMVDTALSLMALVGAETERPEAIALLRPLVLGLTEEDPERRATYRGVLGRVWKTQGKYEEAEAEHRAMLAFWEQARGPDDAHVAHGRFNLGNVLNKQGKHAEAETEFRASLALREKALGPDHPTTAVVRSLLGNALKGQGKYEEALVEHRAVLASRQKVLGPDHPYVGDSLWYLGETLLAQGRYDEAEARFRGALAVYEKSMGPDHYWVAESWDAIGRVRQAQGRYDEAEAMQRAAVELSEKTRTTDHPDVADRRWNLADTLLAQGRYEEAKAEYEAALAVYDEHMGSEHPWVADSWEAIGSVLQAQGKPEEAEAKQRAALALREKVLDSDHPDVAKSKSTLADLLLELHREAEAHPLAEEAWARRQRDDIPKSHRAQTAFVLARILWTIEGPARDRTRSRELAEDALRSYRAAGPAHQDEALEVEQWWGAHRAP